MKKKQLSIYCGAVIQGKEFLNLITTYLETFNIHINLSEKLFLFGFDEDQKLTNILQFILLYAKCINLWKIHIS